jgi:PAS domain-containing protein
MKLKHENKLNSGFPDSAGSTPDPDQELAELRQQMAELEALEVTRRQTEAALAQERNLLRTLIDNLPDYIYFKDTKSRFIIGNMAVAQLMGAITPDELVGKTDFDFYPPELAAQ